MVFIASTSASFGRLGTGLSSSIARTIAPLLQANAKDVKEVTFFTPLALVLLTVGTNVLVISLSASCQERRQYARALPYYINIRRGHANCTSLGN